MQFKKLITNWRIIILLFFLVMSVLAINPRPFNEGASIRSIDLNSSASIAGISSPKPGTVPLSREKIIAIDNNPITNAADYYSYQENLIIGEPVQVKTNKALYKLIVKEENGLPYLGMRVFDAPTTNIRKGLDLQGGTRIILEPEEEISDDDMEMLLDGMSNRLNIYGLSDVVIRPTSDLEGKRYIVVEAPAANDEEIKELIAKQGKFEAKVSNKTVFIGGLDITYVCRSADCSGLSPYEAPRQVSDNEWASTFQFSISLTKQAAEKMAAATKDLEVVDDYLSEPIKLYLDNSLVDTLQIGVSLKGQAVTDIAISGPGFGATRAESQYNALQNMKKLQTILKTGSLPVKLNIVKADIISPVLGSSFVKDAIKMMIFAIIAVTLVILIRYRRPAIAIPIMLTAVSEVLIILGVASLFGKFIAIDIAAIAGILVAVGTGVDDQIVIMDESTSKRNREISWIRRMKNAFFIIFAAYFTGVVAMVPLLFAGAGLLKGFAIMTIIGITVGVLITRPAFAAVAEQLYKEE